MPSSTATTASARPRGIRVSPVRRTPVTASIASGTVIPLKACSGVALSAVADST